MSEKQPKFARTKPAPMQPPAEKLPEVESEKIFQEALAQRSLRSSKKRVKRINADLPWDLWEKVEQEMETSGRNFKGFLVYAIKDYFNRNQG